LSSVPNPRPEREAGRSSAARSRRRSRSPSSSDREQGDRHRRGSSRRARRRPVPKPPIAHGRASPGPEASAGAGRRASLISSPVSARRKTRPRGSPGGGHALRRPPRSRETDSPAWDGPPPVRSGRRDNDRTLGGRQPWLDHTPGAPAAGSVGPRKHLSAPRAAAHELPAGASPSDDPSVRTSTATCSARPLPPPSIVVGAHSARVTRPRAACESSDHSSWRICGGRGRTVGSGQAQPAAGR